MLRVHRKSYVRKPYVRKSYVRKDGTRVKAAKVGVTRVPSSNFSIKDRGAKGRGKKVIPKLKKGTLGVNFGWSAAKRRSVLRKKAKSLGEKKVVGKLRAIQVLNKRTNPFVSAKANADSKYVAGSFKDKRYVGYPRGFGRNR